MDDTHAKALETLSPDAPLSERILVNHRRLVGIAIPLIFFEVMYTYTGWAEKNGTYMHGVGQN